MRETQVNMTDLRQRLGDLVNRAAYGGERIVLISRGEPKAAIVGIDDLRRLEKLSAGLTVQRDRYTEALAATDHVRERIRCWQEAHGIEPEDTVETLRGMQEARDHELTDLR